MFKGLSELITSLKELLPKKNYQIEYLDMLKLAMDLSTSQTQDVLAMYRANNLPIDKARFVRIQEDLLKYHLENQIRLISINKKH